MNTAALSECLGSSIWNRLPVLEPAHCGVKCAVRPAGLTDLACERTLHVREENPGTRLDLVGGAEFEQFQRKLRWPSLRPYSVQSGGVEPQGARGASPVEMSSTARTPGIQTEEVVRNGMSFAIWSGH